MFIFIDTEFTDLAPEAELLSLAAVAEDGREFYCEIVPVPGPASAFVKRFVLPLLEGGEAACAPGEFPRRLGDWLAQFDDPVLLSDSDWDIYIVRHALTGARDRRPCEMRVPCADGTVAFRMLVLRALAGGDLALFQETVAGHYAGDPRPHHALVDARAIRAGMLAVRAAHEEGA